MTAKKYVTCLITILTLVIIANLVLWHGYVKKIFIQGDLSRLGSFKINEALTPDKKFPSLHVELADYLRSGKKESFDILTIGDSFSNGPLGVWYQDILASEYGLKVLNFTSNKAGCLNDLYILIQSGILDEINTRVIILESIGHAVMSRVGIEKILLENVERSDVEKMFPSTQASQASVQFASGFFPVISVQANKNFLRDMCYRKIFPEKLSPEIFIAELDRELFTNKSQENLLLYYRTDLNYLDMPANIEMINKNINNAAEILAGKDIKLIFMPCVDKFDLYYPYIKDKHSRPENNLFEKLRSVPDKKYIFIDTKQILQKALENGEKDLYWLSDTHWSWRGMSIIIMEAEIFKFLLPTS